ncbi:MAG: alpha/beta hydrolase [Pseudomonadota bacterium]
MIEDWDDAYANGAHIADAGTYPPRWAAAAAAFRAGLGDRAELDQPYGPGPRHRFDLFHPDGATRGVLIFVHGGYWRAFDKGSWSHLAAGPLARGYAVAMPSYTLCPEVRIGEITGEIAAAFETIAARVAGPIALAGHSAGGHLVCRMASTDIALPGELWARVRSATSISGVHDLRPLLRTAMSDDLRLDAEEAAAESPALATPRDSLRLHAWVGAEERPEFRRQSALIANIWSGFPVETALTETPDRHHFDVIDDLAEAGSLLVKAILAEA